MAKVNCENRNTRKRVDLSKIKKIAGYVLMRSGAGKAEVNIIFVSNQKIRALNRKYLMRDSSTDVIAFPGEGLFLGDIAVSTDKADQNSRIYGTSFKQETALYVIHGILHLLGYEDKTKKGREKIKRLENEFLRNTARYL